MVLSITPILKLTKSEIWFGSLLSLLVLYIGKDVILSYEKGDAAPKELVPKYPLVKLAQVAYFSLGFPGSPEPILSSLGL